MAAISFVYVHAIVLPVGDPGGDDAPLSLEQPDLPHSVSTAGRSPHGN